ncbi:CehA/McbA family metallohydrolase [Thermodesulfobacteriota bacterium]
MFNYEYVGNIHIHSVHSDGSNSIAEIAKKASMANLDFICINDHEHMRRSFNLSEEGFYGDVLVFEGLEIGKRYHHYLAYNLDEIIRSDELEPQEVIDKVNAQGGFGFLAHPFEKGMPLDGSTAYTWNDLSVERYAGICIWNFASRWKESIKTPFHGLFHLAFKRQTLKAPSKETICFWDEQCQKQRTAAVGGSDAHGSLFSWGSIRFKPLSYDFMLNSINIHILLNRKIFNDFESAKLDIYEAMREGRLFIAHDALGSSKGFKYYFISDDGSDLVMGEEDQFQPGNLVVELPYNGDMKLIKDGKEIAAKKGAEAVFPVTEKGVYRLEAYRHVTFFGWRPWIFTNPIYLR